MRLNYKLFFSYLLVVAISLLTVALGASLVAPRNFTDVMEHNMPGGSRGNQFGMHSMMAEVWQTFDEEIGANFRQAVNDALMLAVVVAILMAGVMSWFVSWYIVRPIRDMVEVSQHIAEGNYNERLDVRSSDELGEMAQHFNQMADALATTEEIRRQLLADVSHELKTPLASIKGYMEGLQDGVVPATPDVFQLVHEEADRLQKLVQDLQELSRTEAAAIAIQVADCELGQLVETVITRFRPQFLDSNIQLETAIPDHLPKVLVDRDRTSQVLTNILGNALHYTPAGGRVMLSAKRVNASVQVSIQDTGIGLKADELKQVFQRFYRVDKSRARSSGGSGIGLTIARHLVEAQGGHLWAESPGLNQGSTFHFTLPLA